MVIFIVNVKRSKVEYQKSGADNSESFQNKSSHLFTFAVVTTTSLYWSSGLALLAACLPTLYALLKTLLRKRSLHKGSTEHFNSGAASHDWSDTSIHRRQDILGSDAQKISGVFETKNIAMQDLTIGRTINMAWKLVKMFAKFKKINSDLMYHTRYSCNLTIVLFTIWILRLSALFFNQFLHGILALELLQIHCLKPPSESIAP